ncbi:unnamed protein product [Lampetra fluviatilis]
MRRGSLLLGLAVGLLAATACLCGGASLEETERARARWRREERDTLQDDEDMLMDASGDDSSGEGSGDEKTSMPGGGRRSGNLGPYRHGPHACAALLRPPSRACEVVREGETHHVEWSGRAGLGKDASPVAACT